MKAVGIRPNNHQRVSRRPNFLGEHSLDPRDITTFDSSRRETDKRKIAARISGKRAQQASIVAIMLESKLITIPFAI